MWMTQGFQKQKLALVRTEKRELTSVGWFLYLLERILGTENILASSMNADTWLFDESASYVIFAF